MKLSERGGVLFKLLALLMSVMLLGLVYLLRRPLLRLAGEVLVVDEPLHAADAIIVLGDDNFQADRASHAAELYRAGWAPHIVVSGRQLRRYAGLAELMQRDLVERGVPEAVVMRFPQRTDDTLEEAVGLRRLVVERGWRRIVIVTSNSHTRRARYIFRRVFPSSVEVRMSSARDSDFDTDRWWEARRGRKLFVLESVGFLMAMWELRHSEVSSQQSQALLVVCLGR